MGGLPSLSSRLGVEWVFVEENGKIGGKGNWDFHGNKIFYNLKINSKKEKWQQNQTWIVFKTMTLGNTNN